MVEISDIKDKDSLKAWLEGQPREVSVWIAYRAAARGIPLWWQDVLAEDWARDRNVSALPVLRAALISSIAANLPSEDIRSSAEAARAFVSDAARAAYDVSAANAFVNANSAADAAAAVTGTTAAKVAGTAAHSSAFCTMVSLATDKAFPWTAIRTDAEKADGGSLPEALPLWPKAHNPADRHWAGIKAQVAALPDAADWRFWLDWYDAQLAGHTLLPDPARTWDMLEQIALIDTATWEAGPEVVNPKIREIRELYRLRSEVAALQAEKEAFLASRASQAQRRHNQPPEGLVDDQPEVARQITIIWDSLDEARDELEQDAPDKDKLREIADRLLSALTTIVKYCGKLADAAAMATAKKLGPPGAIALVDQLANNGRLMQFAKDFVTYASGG